MTKTKKIQIFIITAVTLVISTILLWNVLENEEIRFIKEDNKTSQASSNAIVITKEDIQEFVYNYRLNLLAENSLEDEELTNQQKLVLITRYLLANNNADYTKGVDKSQYETYIHYVFGVDAEIENEDIIFNGITIKYDKKKKKYISTEEITYDEPKAIVKKITNYKNNGDKYTIAIKTVYENDQKIYGNIRDYLTNTAPLLENVKTKDFEKKYYEEIENSVEEIEYQFKLEGNHIVMKEISILKDENETEE